MMKPKLYIDIDGVLIGERTQGDGFRLAKGAREFLDFALTHFDCYWLTTRANHGDAGPALEALSPYADEAFMILAQKIKPSKWRTLKTEAINLKMDFYWIDDQLLWTEREALKENGCLDRWIEVNTRANFGDLARAQRLLARLVQKL